MLLQDPAIFAIESSCDDTSVAVLGKSGTLYVQETLHQHETHNYWGGVVPELASREHFEKLSHLADQIIKQLPPHVSIQSVAATCGPGLIGPLLVGASFARGFALGLQCPFIGIHHLRGHLASVFLNQWDCSELFPALTLLCSGGHTQLLYVQADLHAQKLSDTSDDAAGECFDKAAKLLGLGYPGGPAIEKIAATISPNSKEHSKALEFFKKLPSPKSQEGFSFSGLKTAIRLLREKNQEQDAIAPIAWAVQERIAEILHSHLLKASSLFPDAKSLVVCGGVAANQRLRQRLQELGDSQKRTLLLPPLKFATDNAAMIAAAAWKQNPSLQVSEVFARASL